MKIDILTLFPEMFEGPFGESIVKRASDKKLIDIKVRNLRDWAKDKHRTVDDRPYSGGPGMVMKVDIIDRAINDLKKKNKKSIVILTSAKGKKYNQAKADKLSKKDHLIIICGHYEGVDHRVYKHIADEVISIGDYVLSGGEIPAMAIVDSIVRLIPGALGNPDSLSEESHSLSTIYHLPSTNIEYPQYTRPEVYKGWKVPEVLLSGDHKKIEEWKKKNSK